MFGRGKQGTRGIRNDAGPPTRTAMKSVITVENAERVLLVGVALKRRPRGGAPATNLTGQESLAELGELARSAGANVVGSRLQLRDALDSATMVGRGVLEEL